jgi:hypothetical protein
MGRASRFFACNTGPEYPQGDSSQWPGEQNLLFLSASDGKLHDVTATHLPQIKDYSHAYLMLNDGTGRFTIVAQASPGLFAPHIGFNGRSPEELGRSWGGNTTFFADIDNDSDPDDFVAREILQPDKRDKNGGSH